VTVEHHYSTVFGVPAARNRPNPELWAALFAKRLRVGGAALLPRELEQLVLPYPLLRSCSASGSGQRKRKETDRI
jgi:hypothetical protein